MQRTLTKRPQVITAYVHVELMHPNRGDLLPEYWSVFTQLWDQDSSLVYTTAEAVCIAYTCSANEAGLCNFQYFLLFILINL